MNSRGATPVCLVVYFAQKLLFSVMTSGHVIHLIHKNYSVICKNSAMTHRWLQDHPIDAFLFLLHHPKLNVAK